MRIPGMGEGGGAEYFAAWSRQIGELASLPPWSPTLFRLDGVGSAGRAGVAAAAAAREDDVAGRVPVAQLLLLILVWALTCWQVRWGYFLPLVYALGVPWQFGAVPAALADRRWTASAARCSGRGGRMVGRTCIPPAERASPPRRAAHRRRPAARDRRLHRAALRLPAADANPAADPRPARRHPRPVVALARAGVLVRAARAWRAVRTKACRARWTPHVSTSPPMPASRRHPAPTPGALGRRLRAGPRPAHRRPAVRPTPRVRARAWASSSTTRPELAPRFLRLALVNPLLQGLRSAGPLFCRLPHKMSDPTACRPGSSRLRFRGHRRRQRRVTPPRAPPPPGPAHRAGRGRRGTSAACASCAAVCRARR